MIIANTRMRKLVSSLKDPLKIELNEKNILSDPCFYESEGFVLLKETEEIEEVNKEKVLKIYKDYTGYEAFCNEYNVEDYFDTGNEELVSLQIVFKLADIWKERLEAQFADYTFIISISRSEDYSNIRFYRYRPKEAPWLLLNNLDGYLDEAVAAVIVNPTEELRNINRVQVINI